jgi:hypothetical protein
MSEHAVAAKSPADAVAEKPPLDEIMLAMDVVDTLRHRERVIERALSADDHDAELVSRLRDIYAGQGIEVSEAVIEQGVKDLRENRFAYEPTPPSFARSLAALYATRSRWGWPVVSSVALVAVALTLYQVLYRGPEIAFNRALPGAIDESYQALIELAEEPEVDAEAAAIHADAEAALAREDYAGARAAVTEFDRMADELRQVYEVRIRQTPGELSGVWREPEDNPRAQNYYLIVEAIDDDGNRITLPITNEETGETRRVAVWGQRVDEATFDAVSADKRDDGIIQNRVIGSKHRGMLDPDFKTGVLSGAITSW